MNHYFFQIEKINLYIIKNTGENNHRVGLRFKHLVTDDPTRGDEILAVLRGEKVTYYENFEKSEVTAALWRIDSSLPNQELVPILNEEDLSLKDIFIQCLEERGDAYVGCNCTFKNLAGFAVKGRVLVRKPIKLALNLATLQWEDEIASTEVKESFEVTL